MHTYGVMIYVCDMMLHMKIMGITEFDRVPPFSFHSHLFGKNMI